MTLCKNDKQLISYNCIKIG